MQPIIGITAGKDLSDTTIHKTSLIDKYYQAIIASGGVPVIFPSEIPLEVIPELFPNVNGILITGGGDIEPKIFNGEDHPRVYGVDTIRDGFETELVRLAEKNQIPLLGICRGHQIINVALGGNLYTDIHDQVPDSNKHDWFPGYPRDQLSHTINIIPGTLLHQIIGHSSIQVNSLHHQAIKTIASNLKPSAFSSDGIIEAIELDHHPFFLGVQWHPEWLFSYQTTQNIFNSFINACKNNE